MVSNSRDLQFYAQWCARLADECDIPAVADKLRKMSRDLIVKAQNEARLHSEVRI
jgi:tRNA isopentenyl-2-thiomethyl-A-37 hydroxylase MiaE